MHDEEVYKRVTANVPLKGRNFRFFFELCRYFLAIDAGIDCAVSYLVNLQKYVTLCIPKINLEGNHE